MFTICFYIWLSSFAISLQKFSNDGHGQVTKTMPEEM